MNTVMISCIEFLARRCAQAAENGLATEALTYGQAAEHLATVEQTLANIDFMRAQTDYYKNLTTAAPVDRINDPQET